MSRKRKRGRTPSAAIGGKGRLVQMAAAPPRMVPGTDPQSRSKYSTWLPEDQRQQAILRSEDALYGRYTYAAGETTANVPYYPGSGLDPRKLANINTEVRQTGRMIQKADLDEQILDRDAHLEGVDKAMRVAVTGREFRVEPFDETDLSLILRDLGEAMFDDLDRFDGSAYELLDSHGSGVAYQEAIFEPKSLKIASAGVRVAGAWPQKLEQVHGRNFRYHPVKDYPKLEITAGKFVDIFDPPYKFLFHWATGRGPKRCRGHLRQTAWLHMIKHDAVARWAHCLDFWGIPVPYQLLDETKYQNAELKNSVLEQLERAGLGEPFIGLAGEREGMDIQHTPTPSGLDARGMHAALIGWCNSEQSKSVQLETLTTEMGGVGGYNTANVHENTKESMVRMMERGLRSTLREWLRSVFELNRFAIAAALGVSPEAILAHVPRVYWLVESDLTPDKRLDMLVKGVNELGMSVAKRQAYRQFGWDPARRPEDAIPGKPQTLGKDDKAVSTIQAAGGEENHSAEMTNPASTDTGGGVPPTSN